MEQENQQGAQKRGRGRPPGKGGPQERKIRQARLEVVLSEHPDITVDELSQRFNVSTRTITEDLKLMRQGGKQLKRDLAKAAETSQAVRDEVFQFVLDTKVEVQSQIRQTQDLILMLKRELDAVANRRRELEHDDDAPPQLVSRVDREYAALWQAIFKGQDSATQQLTLLAKLLGQLNDSPHLAIIQIDSDVNFIMETLAQIDREAARKLYNALLSESSRRRALMGEFVQIAGPDVVEGEFKVIEGEADKEGEDY